MIKQIFLFVLYSPILIMSCNQSVPPTFDVQGHRGCRGLYPENTIPAFLYAAQIGVTTLEMDVVINRDQEVIVSHEPFYSHEYTTLGNGEHLLPGQGKTYNIFKMTYGEMKELDVGIKQHPKFKFQQNVEALKPRLKDVFEQLSIYDTKFNIEIKRVPEEDGKYHPEVNTFVDLVVETIHQYNMKDKVTLQSFDLETLQILKKKYPEFPLAFLTDNFRNDFNKNIQALGFMPDIYSPRYTLVSRPLINICHKKGVKIIPWTVNNPTVIRKLIHWGVDGMITDYPDKLLSILQTKGWTPR